MEFHTPVNGIIAYDAQAHAEIKLLRSQLQEITASHVRFILEANTQHQEDQKKIEALQNEVQGVTKDHVAMIICHAQLEAENLELTSKNKKLEEELRSVKAESELKDSDLQRKINICNEEIKLANIEKEKLEAENTKFLNHIDIQRF